MVIICAAAESKEISSLSTTFRTIVRAGSAEFALIPSTNAIMFLLRRFGFEHVEVLPPDDGDYEQFARFSRVLIYGCKP